MIYDIIQQNFISVTIIIFLILFILTNNNFDKTTNKLFLSSAICVLLFIGEEAWEAQLAKLTTFVNLRLYLSIVGYILRPMTAYFLVMIISKRTYKQTLLLSVPIIINTLVTLSALFSKWSFWYTENNQFMRGPLGYTPFITAGFYVLTILLITMKKCKKGDLMETMTISAIVVLTIVATIMESVYHFASIQSAASGISITFYYLFLHTNQNNRDPLTGTLTRRRFYLDAEKYRLSLTAIISLDLNNLKLVNDQQGHIAGDKALITMTNVVKKCTTKKASLYRSGGDEFMILCFKMKEEEVKELINLIQKSMEKTEYRCAIGYGLYNYRAEFESVCQIADAAMYENKVKMKGLLK